MIGYVPDPRLSIAVGNAFGQAASKIRTRASESVRAEEDRGERSTREETYTDELINLMRDSIRAQIETAASSFLAGGGRSSIEFESASLPVLDETRFGVDIGLRVTIRTSTAIVVKGILIQCKRMYGPQSSPTYPRLRDDGETQARRMLRLTPASFFVLFNFGSQIDLLDWASVPAGMLCPVDDRPFIPADKREQIGNACPHWARTEGSIWDLGISVLPASRVLSISAASRMASTPFPVEAPLILRGCLPLGMFIVDLLASCFVGDPREEVVRLVTAPRLRERFVSVTGLSAHPDFEGFAVRHYIDVTITGEGQ